MLSGRLRLVLVRMFSAVRAIKLGMVVASPLAMMRSVVVNQKTLWGMIGRAGMFVVRVGIAVGRNPLEHVLARAHVDKQVDGIQRVGPAGLEGHVKDHRPPEHQQDFRKATLQPGWGGRRRRDTHDAGAVGGAGQDRGPPQTSLTVRKKTLMVRVSCLFLTMTPMSLLTSMKNW